MISTSDGVVHEMHVQWAERMQGTEKRQWWWESVWEEARVEDDRSEFQKPKRKMKNEREKEKGGGGEGAEKSTTRSGGAYMWLPKTKKKEKKEERKKGEREGKGEGGRSEKIYHQMRQDAHV